MKKTMCNRLKKKIQNPRSIPFNQILFNGARNQSGFSFLKHIENKHGGLKKGEKFEDYFDIIIIKSYKKPIQRYKEEGTFIINYKGEILNSKN